MSSHHPHLPLDADAPSAGTPPGPALALVAVGGAAGAVARWSLERLWPAGDGIPWGTLVINLSGALLLGVLMAVVVERRRGPVWLRPLVGVGLLGGYTTFSTLALELRDLLASGQGGSAAAYVVVTVVGGLAAALAGIALGERAVP
jgi:CrcB protein